MLSLNEIDDELTIQVMRTKWREVGRGLKEETSVGVSRRLVTRRKKGTNSMDI